MRGENKALESEWSEAVEERAGAELRATEGRRGGGEGKGVYREINLKDLFFHFSAPSAARVRLSDQPQAKWTQNKGQDKRKQA